MKKKISISVIITLVVFCVVLVAFFITYNNDSDNPFDSLPLKISKNCTTEYKYKFNISINSPKEFIDFLKNNQNKFVDKYGNNWLRFDNFKNNINGNINWENMIKNVKTTTIDDIKIYQLKYYTNYCRDGFILRISNTGYISINKCCKH